MDFVLVADKKFVFPVKNQRNLSFFSGFRWFLKDLKAFLLRFKLYSMINRY